MYIYLHTSYCMIVETMMQYDAVPQLILLLKFSFILLRISNMNWWQGCYIYIPNGTFTICGQGVGVGGGLAKSIGEKKKKRPHPFLVNTQGKKSLS